MQWEVRRFDTLDSTNRYLIDEAAAGAPDGTVAVARHQTAGRGRRGRVWDSKPGSSLLFSVLLRPRSEVTPEQFPQAVALAITDACELEAGFNASLKWPNDVVVDSRKLAGILSEVASEAGEITAIVVGCGVNLNWGRSMPEALRESAVSADEIVGHEIDVDAFLDGVLRALNERINRPAWLSDAYRARCSTLGTYVRVQLADHELEGTATDLTDSGGLIVTDDGGVAHEINVGDVVHLRVS